MNWNGIKLNRNKMRGLAVMLSLALIVSMMSVSGVDSKAKVRNKLYVMVDESLSKEMSKDKQLEPEKISAPELSLAAGTIKCIATDKSIGNTAVKSLFSSGPVQPSVETPPEGATNLFYTGSAQVLLSNPGSVTGSGYMVYSTNYNADTHSGTWSDVVPKGTNHGTYNIYYGASTTRTGAPEQVSDPISVVIGKADWGSKSCQHTSNYGTTVTLGVSNFIAPGGVMGTFTTSDPNQILSGAVEKTADNKLKYTIVNDSSKKGCSATVTIPISNAMNYNDYNLTVTLRVHEKEVPTLSVSNIKKTYNGYAITKSSISGTAKCGDTAVYGTWDFVNAGELKDVSDSGRKTVRFTPNDIATYAVTDAVITVTISPKDVTVTADNKTKAIGERDPKFTATVSGLLNKDTVEYTLSRTAGETAGNYTIKAEGEKYQGNYAVTYKNGTLKIGSTSTPTPKPTSTPKASATPRPTATATATVRPTATPKRTTSPDEPLVDTYTNKSGQDVTTVTKVDEDGNRTETKTVTDPKTGEVISSTVTWITEDPKTGDILTESKTLKGNGSIILSTSTEKESGQIISSTYRVKDTKKNTVVATGTTLSGGDGAVIIPASVTIHGVTYNVKAIAKAAFRSNSTTKKIIVESGITKIDDQAFSKSAVTSVRIGKSVKTIGEKVFLEASKLKEIEIRADKLKSIGKDAFKGTAEGLTILIVADKKTYKHIVKLIMDSGKLPKKIKFKRKKE